MRRQITIGEVIDAGRFADLSARYSSMPGIVTAFYPGTQGASPPTVDVQAAVQDVRLDTTTGAIAFEPFPVLQKIPVAYLRGGGFAFWFPLRKGDDVQLVAHDLDPSAFRATGAHAKPVLTRRNSGAFWWAYPGSIADPNGLPDPQGALCIGIPGGGIIAIGSDGKVNLGSATPADAVALASKLDTLNGFLKAFAQAMGAVPATGPLAPLSAAVTAAGTLASNVPLTVASQTVKTTP